MKCHRIHTVWSTVMVEASVQKFPYSAGSCSTFYGVDVVYLKEKKKKKQAYAGIRYFLTSQNH